MNYLYFFEGADTYLVGDVVTPRTGGVIYPASSLRCVEQTADGVVTLHFTPLAITKVIDGDVVDAVPLTVTSGKEKEVMEAIAKAVNDNVNFSSGFVTIADDAKGVYAHADIIDIQADRTANGFNAIVFAA